MRRDPLTTYMVDRYTSRPGSETLRAMAEQLGMSTRTVYARLYRAGALRGDPHAMFHSDEALVAAYQRLGSLARVVAELGVQFYVLRAVLARNGVQVIRPRKPPKVAPEVVIAKIQELRSQDVEWGDIAHRLGINRATLWGYRRRLGLAS